MQRKMKSRLLKIFISLLCLFSFTGYGQTVKTINSDCTSVPGAPTGNASQTFCRESNPTVANLSATGTSIKWYNSATGGGLMSPSTAITLNTTYYASQTVNGCESTSRLAVIGTLYNLSPRPDGSSPQFFCATSNPTVASLSATGTSIKWYNTAKGGDLVSLGTALINGTTYYASQTINGCESETRLPVEVIVDNIPAAPTGNASQTFCSGSNPRLVNISINGKGIIWYDAPTGGNALNQFTVLTNGTTYYASQTTNSCRESITRLAVTVSLDNNGNPPAPTGNASQSVCSGFLGYITTSYLSVTGTGIKWYNTAAGGNEVRNNEPLTNGATYYASQTVNGCESIARLPVKLTIVNTPKNPKGETIQDFCEFANATVANLVTDQTGVIWYDKAIGGNVIDPKTPLTNMIYYGTLKVGSCESDSRLAVRASIKVLPNAPIGATTQIICESSNPTVANLSVRGRDIKWYDAAAGGNIVISTTALKDGTTYYASQTSFEGCESTKRLPVKVEVKGPCLDVALKMTVDNAEPKVGEEVVFTVTTENLSANNAEEVEISTLLPSGFEYVKSQATSGTYSFISRVWTLPVLAGLAKQTLSLAAKVKEPGNYLNVASLINSIPLDINTVNNRAEVSFTNITLGARDFESSNYFALYPNPVSDVLTIKTKQKAEIQSLEVYDILGQLVIAVPSAKSVSAVDVSRLTAGSYFIKVKSDKGSFKVKFIKK